MYACMYGTCIHNVYAVVCVEVCVAEYLNGMCCGRIFVVTWHPMEDN